MKSAAPFYEAFGARRMRLLQNVDDPARFVHEIEYEAHELIEVNRQRVASDPRVQASMQAWRSLFPARSKSTSIRRSSDGVDGPLAASTCQSGALANHQEQGAIHERDYDDWPGSSQACFSGSRH